MKKNKPANPDPLTELSALFELVLTSCDVTVCLASVQNHDDVPRFESLQLSDDLTDEFQKIAGHVIGKCRDAHKDGDLRLLPYDAGSKPDSHEVEHIYLPDHEPIKEQIASLSSPVNLSTFELDAGFLSGLRFYAIVVQPAKREPFYLFRLYGPSKELSRSKLFGAIMTKGSFDRIKEPAFLFDQRVDCICQGDFMFILNKDGFQKIFRFFELVREAARETLKKIKARIPIANFEDLEKACEGHLQMLAKLNNIANRPYLAKVTMTDIKKVVTDFPDLRVQITVKDGQEMLLFDKSDKWELLRLLDDDYLNSVMTEEHYEVSGKRAVKKKQ